VQLSPHAIISSLLARRAVNSRISNNSLVLAQFFNSQSNWKTGGNLKLKERKEIGATFKRIGKTVSLLPPHFKTTPFSVEKDFFSWKLIEYITQKKKTPACIILLKMLPAKKIFFKVPKRYFFSKKKSDWIIHCEKKQKEKRIRAEKETKKSVLISFPSWDYIRRLVGLCCNGQGKEKDLRES